MTIDTKTLLPCPFCGGDAFVSVNCADTNARCAECFSEGPAFSNDEDNTQAAIDAWNHRDAADRLSALEADTTLYCPECTHVGEPEGRCCPSHDKAARIPKRIMSSIRRDKRRIEELEEQLHLANVDALQTEAERSELEAENQRLREAKTAAFTLSAQLCAVRVVTELHGYELIRRESVMNLVMRWRQQNDKALKAGGE